MATVAFRSVAKQFGDKSVLKGLDLEIADGEFLVLLGPSGCGKTTALRMVAGLESPTSGDIEIDGVAVTDLPPRERDVAMVFQSYALYPHLSVAKNIEFPLRQTQMSKAERAAKVTEAATMLGLADLVHRKPRELSGGQRQRVALARAIVRNPVCFLMDEPLSNLDATLRAQTRSDIVTLQRRLGTTTIFVTHDQVEAMTMGDRIAVMHEGVLQQVGTPTELFFNPANAFVAGFVGNPGMNLIHAARGDGELRVGEQSLGAGPATGTGPVLVGVRAEDLVLDPSGVDAICTGVEILGAEVHLLCSIGEDHVVVRQSATAPRPGIGEACGLRAAGNGVLLFDPTSGQRLS